MGRKTANRAKRRRQPGPSGPRRSQNGGNGHGSAPLRIEAASGFGVKEALESLRASLLEAVRSDGSLCGGHAAKAGGPAPSDELIALLCVDGRQCVLDARPPLEQEPRRSGNGGGAQNAQGPLLGERWESYLERTPLRDLERQKLLLLLERHEWNIARVARLLGTTRRTVYARLERYRIARRRVRKAPTTRRAPAPQHVSRRSRGPRRGSSS